MNRSPAAGPATPHLPVAGPARVQRFKSVAGPARVQRTTSDAPSSATQLNAASSYGRAGFTLLELVLVLSILVAVAAIVAPSVGDAFKRHRLIASADQLRNVWDRARLTAMKTGQIQAFTCEIGSGTYTVKPYMTSDDMNNASAGATMLTTTGVVAEANKYGTMSAPTAEPTEESTDQSGSGESLEDDITFVSCAVGNDMRSYSLAQQQSGLAGVASANQIVMFYPDGSTSTAEVIIQSPTGKQKGVRMRGLTGATQVLTPGEQPTEVAQ